MSTRATYQIQDKTFYIHHDGYPSGAVECFANMINSLLVKSELTDADYAEHFAATNERASEVPSHESHGDTEYQYTLSRKDDQLHMTVYLVWSDLVIFDGLFIDFLKADHNALDEAS